MDGPWWWWKTRCSPSTHSFVCSGRGGRGTRIPLFSFRIQFPLPHVTPRRCVFWETFRRPMNEYAGYTVFTRRWMARDNRATVNSKKKVSWLKISKNYFLNNYCSNNIYSPDRLANTIIFVFSIARLQL